MHAMYIYIQSDSSDILTGHQTFFLLIMDLNSDFWNF